MSFYYNLGNKIPSVTYWRAQLLCSSASQFFRITTGIQSRPDAFDIRWWIVFVIWLTDGRRLALDVQPGRLSISRISDTPRARIELVQNLSLGFVEWSCAVVITTRLVMTFLTNSGVRWILYSFRLVLEVKAGEEINESWRFESLEKFSAILLYQML